MPDTPQSASPPRPLSLIAELTHRCPLHCLYCSNPLELQRADDELSTADWKQVFQQAAQLDILHLHLTGGEPLARKDLPELISVARDAGLYVNMITSGVGLTASSKRPPKARTPRQSSPRSTTRPSAGPRPSTSPASASRAAPTPRRRVSSSQVPQPQPGSRSSWPPRLFSPG